MNIKNKIKIVDNYGKEEREGKIIIVNIFQNQKLNNEFFLFNKKVELFKYYKIFYTH